MSPPLWALSLPIGCMYIFVPRAVSLVLQIKSGAPLQNSRPREHAESKEVAAKDTHGYVRRAYASHQNSWEAMILWSTAVVLAKVTGVEESRMNTTAAVWLAARFIYVPAYVLIKSNTTAYFRSVVFIFTFPDDMLPLEVANSISEQDQVGMTSSFNLMWHAALKA